VLVAVGFVVLVRAGGLGLVNLAAKVPILMPLIYLNIMIAIAICAVMLLKPPRRPGLARIPVAEGT
jgi:hypothetical protein